MVNGNYIRLSQWAARHGMHRMTAWRHYNAGTLPPELQPKKIGNIISRALVVKYHTLGVETLNVAGMIRTGLQAKGYPNE